ncbi:hypothetical protein ABRT01_02915 [Lentibacillus sp. L22]|uniref:hypothetical protein n=1 Tax=Lentibacillus TaxID=175304 RepID=UPI0022B09EF3|nr:hypothetical protein [Lentibacillus daqui]
MENRDVDQKVIENYENAENMMILVFAQWCINHDLHPMKLYQRAYPTQSANQALAAALEHTVPKAESEEISDQTVLQVLQLFGNNDLAYVVQSEIEQRKE